MVAAADRRILTPGPASGPPTPPAKPAAVSKLKTFALVIAVTLLNCFGNLSLAWGMKHAVVRVGLDPTGYLRAMLNPFVALGIGLLILWLLTRMALLSWADLSFVLPVTAVGYFLSALAGHFFLQETITSAQWLGTLLIFAGTALVGTTGQQTTGQQTTGEQTAVETARQ